MKKNGVVIALGIGLLLILGAFLWQKYQKNESEESYQEEVKTEEKPEEEMKSPIETIIPGDDESNN